MIKPVNAYASVPSPFPYLSGEYNLRSTTGTKTNLYDYTNGYTADTFISGCQVEVAFSIRTNDALRVESADVLAETILTYLADILDWP